MGDWNGKMRTIVGVESFTFDGFVYDLSTEDGTFCVLPHDGGSVTMKNTDSVYVRWIDMSMEESFRISDEAAAFASAQFPQPIMLEFEKVMCPLALYTKKRYSYQMWTRPDQPDARIQHVGTQVIRRDTCLFVRDMLGHVLDLILKEGKTDEALAYTRQSIHALFEGTVDLEKLTITRSYRDNYVNNNIPHVKLATRLRERNDCDMVRAGERIAFVLVESADGLETPSFAKSSGMAVDANAYFEKQLKTPLDMIWSLVMDADKVYEDMLRSYQKKKKKRNDVLGYMKLFHTYPVPLQ